MTNADGDPVIAAPDQWVYAGAAPNLTNLMTRNTFAGASGKIGALFADRNKLEATDGKFRGMPNLGLSEDQIDQLVAYLLERK